MRGTVATRIRNEVYGGDKVTSSLFRRYNRDSVTGQIIADANRHAYQVAKKRYMKKGQIDGR